MIKTKSASLIASSVLTSLLALFIPISASAAPSFSYDWTPSEPILTTDLHKEYEVTISNNGDEPFKCVGFQYPEHVTVYDANIITGPTDWTVQKTTSQWGVVATSTAEFEPATSIVVQLFLDPVSVDSQPIMAVASVESDCSTTDAIQSSQYIEVVEPEAPPEPPSELTPRDYQLLAHVFALGITFVVTYVIASTFRFRL